ncbi:MAG: hypothetical protein QXS29_09810 [Nitrososphaeria archaeon]
MVENWSKVMEGNRPTIYNDNQYLIEEYKKIQQWLKEEKANFLLVKEKNNSVSFKIPVTVNGKQEYVKRTTGEKITLDGLARLKVKCRKLKEYLGSNPSLSQIISFIDGLNKEKQEIVDDRITMEEAVKKVEKWFFQRKDRRKLQRSKQEMSDLKSWDREYGGYYDKLPKQAIVTYETLKKALDAYGIDPDTGETNPYLRKYQDCLRAYIKLCEINKLQDIQRKLEELKVTKDQWQVSKKPSGEEINTEEFYKLREAVLNDPDTRYREEREFWIWVYSVQFVYGLRISEVLHIRNWTEDYCPAKDPEENNPLNFVFPALIDVKKNPEHIIYIGNYREPTPNDKRRKNAKTGWRYVHPIEDPEYPNMFQDFGIIEGIKKHLFSLKQYNRNTFLSRANRHLRKWSKKYLGKEIRGTHTFRRAAAEIKYITTENEVTYENEMGHGVGVAKGTYLKKDPEVTKRMEKKKKMIKAKSGELKVDIATAKQVISEAYKNVSPEAKKEARQLIILIFQLLFGLHFDPEEL